ncbi:hypothetical protein EXIGUO9Y_40007 [Exiguobacterium oxidotolerans]|uniref:Uncharacterized protein n=1 Tax=Exiguobacterium oxidotolerans TaxID=223958 RepID=A0A653IHW7_9BACL|nr:hypothetical protein EXIGUO9Y_40007 [Exiguobacterium oxidotolerans]
MESKQERSGAMFAAGRRLGRKKSTKKDGKSHASDLPSSLSTVCDLLTGLQLMKMPPRGLEPPQCCHH